MLKKKQFLVTLGDSLDEDEVEIAKEYLGNHWMVSEVKEVPQVERHFNLDEFAVKTAEGLPEDIQPIHYAIFKATEDILNATWKVDQKIVHLSTILFGLAVIYKQFLNDEFAGNIAFSDAQEAELLGK